jgi:exodeoxyribonuclease VII large subunit
MRSRPVLADPVREIDRLTEQVVDLRDRARRSLTVALDRSADGLAHTRARLHALSPATTLARGYAVVQREDGSVVRSAAEPDVGERLRIRFAEDSLTAAVEAVHPADADTGGADDTADGTAADDADTDGAGR